MGAGLICSVWAVLIVLKKGYSLLNVLVVGLYNSNITKVAQQTCPRAGPSTRGLSKERQATAFDKETMIDNKNDSSVYGCYHRTSPYL